ncbi:MAG: HU family DNA-binding protein [Candidatus Marinimicrobia bacterium]|nr:HU family DNA-binding protein [Candidatus Neomarinimicrobiota bacterium]MCF7829677.1 HU family DNA-binding protein [Candidatus Neomarinimicrobiota bacterium]MCF7879837.1 HU family DNA-binding protein [Candidatus Neomarinimicrobiota bacterium]
MNKSELIDSMAEKGGITKADAERALNAFTDTVTETLAGDKDEKITLVGFGTFSTSDRAARTGRNPQTGETINIPATTVPKFKAGKSLKDAVKG